MIRKITRRRSSSLINRTHVLAFYMPVHAVSWILLAFSAGTILSAVLQRHLLEDTQTAQHLVEFNVGEAFALAAILSLVLTAPHKRPSLAGFDVAVLLLSALAWFVPEQHGVYLATTLAGAWVLMRGHSNRQMIGIGQVWLALSVYELWGKLLFKLAYHMIEVVEVSLIYRVGRLFYGSLGVNGANLSIRDDWTIVVLEGCSSFHNLSLTVLIWLSILKLAEQRVGLATLRALGVSAYLVIVINVTRILLMLPSHEAYVFWHDGVGSSLVALISVLAAIIPVLLHAGGRTCQISPPV